MVVFISFVVVLVNIFVVVRRRFCEFELFLVLVFVLILVINDDDVCIEYKMLISNVFLMYNFYLVWMCI